MVAAGVLVLAGCGGSKAPSIASVGKTSAATTTAPAATAGAPKGQTQLQQGLLKYSECMRANGVPSFPDPSPSGGFEFSASSGVDPSSPTMKAAQAKCQKLMPGGGPPAGATHPTAQWLAQMEKTAQCMRRHGVPSFPDPRTSVPATPFPDGGTGVVSDIDGVVLVFPSTLDTQSPAFQVAAKTCDFPLRNH